MAQLKALGIDPQASDAAVGRVLYHKVRLPFRCGISLLGPDRVSAMILEPVKKVLQALGAWLRPTTFNRHVMAATARFNEQSREILAFALQEAYRFNHEAIDWAHLLLGAIRFSDSENPTALCRARAEVFEALGSPDLVTIRPMRASAAAMRVFRTATALATAETDLAVRPEHLWLALLESPEPDQQKLLSGVGINVAQTIKVAKDRINS